MALVAPWSKALCPFCFHRFHLAAAPRRRTAGDKLPDLHVRDFLGVAQVPDMHKVEAAPAGADAGFFAGLLRSFLVPDDWKGDLKKICPNCHLFLPHATACGQLASEVIAVIGDRQSGKSNYFGVLLRDLESRRAFQVGFTMYDQETFLAEEFRSINSGSLYARRYGRLFERDAPMAIDQTAVAAQNTDLRIPLIYRFEFPPRPTDWLTRPLARRRCLDLVIFDAAGEDMRSGDPDRLDRFYRYLAAASGIIFLIDPVQCDGLRDKLAPDIQRRFKRDPIDQAGIVASVINLYQNRRGLKAGQPLPVPIAFAFAKSDLFREAKLVDSSSRLFRDGRHEGGFDAADCRNLSAEMEAYLHRWGSTQLLQLARDKVRTSAFFALSALGQTPDEKLHIRPVEPRRVADPLLWLLWQRGYIRAVAEPTRIREVVHETALLHVVPGGQERRRQHRLSGARSRPAFPRKSSVSWCPWSAINCRTACGPPLRWWSRRRCAWLSSTCLGSVGFSATASTSAWIRAATASATSSRTCC